MVYISSKQHFKTFLTGEQISVLEYYYNAINKMPKKPEKTYLANLCNLDPIVVNKWFQAKRTRDAKTQRKTNKK